MPHGMVWGKIWDSAVRDGLLMAPATAGLKYQKGGEDCIKDFKIFVFDQLCLGKKKSMWVPGWEMRNARRILSEIQRDRNDLEDLRVNGRGYPQIAVLFQGTYLSAY